MNSFQLRFARIIDRQWIGAELSDPTVSIIAMASRLLIIVSLVLYASSAEINARKCYLSGSVPNFDANQLGGPYCSETPVPSNWFVWKRIQSSK